MIREFLKQAEGEFSFTANGLPMAMCAVGGYGRQEQHPLSDVDLLFLHREKNITTVVTLAETILYRLWDLGFSVGHAVRTVEESLQLAERDLTIRTSLLDIRFLGGDEELFLGGKRTLMQSLFFQRPRQFVEAKLEELKARRNRYGDTAFLLEPNLKESPGALRDLHTVFWVGKAIFKIDELRDLYRIGILERKVVDLFERAQDELLFLRTLVHLYNMRQRARGDRLTLELQDEIAAFLGYKDSPVELAAERLMRDYYEITRGVRRAVDAALKKMLQEVRPRSFHAMFSRKRPVAPGFHIYQGELHARLGEFDQHPHRLIEAFALKARYRVPFSYDLARTLEDKGAGLRMLSQEERLYAANWFKELFTYESHVAEVLSEMNEFKVLGEFLPPFRHIYSRVQRDTYHTYTVDQHLLFSLKHFYELRQKKRESEAPELTALALSIGKPFLLALGILTHDIGKGYGVDHTLKGEELVGLIGEKLFLSQEEIEDLKFLVRNHLLLTHTMQRRDIADSQVLKDLAGIIPDGEHLKMLLLLTYCDLLSVGPQIWNEWKQTLLLQLYEDLRVVLEQGDIAGIQTQRIARNREILRQELLHHDQTLRAVRFLEALPPSFFLRHKGELGVLAIRCIEKVEEEGFGIEVAPGPGGMSWVLMAARDRPGLLSLEAGTLFTGGFSIMEAEGYVLKGEGIALNLFLVVHPDPLFFSIPERKEGFLKLAREIEGGERTLAPPPALPSVRPRSRRRIRVQANDTLSQDYTVIEVFCWDRPGLLYQLTEALYRCGCTIHLARIHTEGQRVSDTFYVQDAYGRRLSPEHRSKVMDELLKIARTT